MQTCDCIGVRVYVCVCGWVCTVEFKCVWCFCFCIFYPPRREDIRKYRIVLAAWLQLCGFTRRKERSSPPKGSVGDLYALSFVHSCCFRENAQTTCAHIYTWLCSTLTLRWKIMRRNMLQCCLDALFKFPNRLREFQTLGRNDLCSRERPRTARLAKQYLAEHASDS